MNNEITIMPNGELMETYWEYDEISQKGGYKTRDVTSRATSLMFSTVSLHKDLKLKDILLLIKKDLPFYSLYLSNWVEEFVNEGLNNEPTQIFDDVEYLELYWNLYHEENEDTKGKTIGGYDFPDFHMVSKKLMEDKYDESGNLIHQANQRIDYSLSFIPTNNLANIPIKLEKRVLLSNDSNFEEKPLKFDDCSYTLGHVLYGIIWELSWYGSPSNRDLENERLKLSIQELDFEI